MADSSSGAFSNVVVTGLEPGFEFEIDAANGEVTLTALNDGVSITQPSPRTLFLPLIARP